MTGISLVDEVDGHLTRVTADPAYDTRAFDGAAGARGARVGRWCTDPAPSVRHDRPPGHRSDGRCMIST